MQCRQSLQHLKMAMPVSLHLQAEHRMIHLTYDLILQSPVLSCP